MEALPTTPPEPEPPAWAQRGRTLGLRDERPVLEERLDDLSVAFRREREALSTDFGEMVANLEERMTAAAGALAASQTALARSLSELGATSSPSRSDARRLARELEKHLGRLYRRVRLAPGRGLDRIAPRQNIRTLLEQMQARCRPEVERFPQTASILKARRGAPQIPAGQRICDVHRTSLLEADRPSGLPLSRRLRRSLTRLRLWSSYEVLEVPARDIARTSALDATALQAGELGEELVQVHAAAWAALEETWQIVRSNLEVALEELAEYASGAGFSRKLEDQDEGEESDPAARIAELGEIVTGALSRAGERAGTIAPPLQVVVTSLLDAIAQDQERILEQLKHDLEESERLSVRARWARQRARGAIAHRWGRVVTWFRRIGRKWARVVRRGYFRAEDATARIGRVIGVTARTQDTLLAFADLRAGPEAQENANAVPPIYRRLFSPAPLKTREFVTAREDTLASLTEVVARWEEERPSSVAVVGPEGSGKTTLMNCLEAELDDDVAVLRCEFRQRVRSLAELTTTVAGWFGLEATSEDPAELGPKLLEGPRQVVVVEEVHNLMLRAMGGRQVPEAFMALVLATRSHLLWVITARQYPWRRMDDILRISRYFTHQIPASFHSSDQLREAILVRHRSSGLQLHFSEKGVTDRGVRKLLLSHEAEAPVVQQALESRFFAALFAASGGNMDSALFYWKRSLQGDSSGERVIVASLERPDAAFLTDFERPYLFTLAEILNHGTLTVAEHAEIFRQPESTSRTAFDYLQQLNLIVAVPPSDGSPEQFEVNPVCWHLVSSTLETMSILY